MQQEASLMEQFSFTGPVPSDATESKNQGGKWNCISGFW